MGGNGRMYGEVELGKMWEGVEGVCYRIEFGGELEYYSVGIGNGGEGMKGDGKNGAE